MQAKYTSLKRLASEDEARAEEGLVELRSPNDEIT
jgi:hypothetical protein